MSRKLALRAKRFTSLFQPDALVPGIAGGASFRGNRRGSTRVVDCCAALRWYTDCGKRTATAGRGEFLLRSNSGCFPLYCEDERFGKEGEYRLRLGTTRRAQSTARAARAYGARPRKRAYAGFGAPLRLTTP